MVYRDETAALRERLLLMEPKFAELSGQAAGLRLRKALVEDDVLNLRKKIVWERRVEVGKFRVGLFLTLSVLAVSFAVLAYSLYSSTLVDESFVTNEVLVQTDKHTRRVGAGEIRINDAVFGKCEALLSWGESESALIKGACDTVHGVSFWGASSKHSFVLSTNVRGGAKGVLRQGPLTVVFTAIRKR